MKILTVGMIKSFIDCPQKYNFMYSEHLDFPTDDKQAEIGKKLHALINYYYKGFDISKITDVDLLKKDNIFILWQNFLEMVPENVVATEFTFNTKLSDNYRLTGRVDALQQNGDKWVILDWKTGKSVAVSAEIDPQTMVYMYCFYKILFAEKKIESYEDISMKYIFLAEKKIKTVNFSKEKYFKFEEFLLNYSEKIYNFDKNPQRPIKPCKDCDNCKYFVFCKGTF
ncbi:MAG: PD-(D/E)XK nuclease family protein [Candidatus Gastranaerophilaceae bacterium]